MSSSRLPARGPRHAGAGDGEGRGGEQEHPARDRDVEAARKRPDREHLDTERKGNRLGKPHPAGG